MEQKYVIVKGYNGSNIWKIIGTLEGLDSYIIETRTTIAMIKKNLCKTKDGSSLLVYEGEDNINIYPSHIEIEKWSEYENYLLHNVYEEELKA